MEKQKLVSRWLTKRFIEMQDRRGERMTVRQLAEYLDVPEGALGHWLNGIRAPTKREYIDKLAVLGLEIYDILGLPRPDFSFRTLTAVWGRLSEDKRQRLLRSALGLEEEPTSTDSPPNQESG
jgi:transcriptional regulator with XRE-family HTH domain